MKIAGRILLTVTAMTLVGCAGQEEQLRPSGVVAMDGAKPIELQAPADGQLSIYDQSIDDLIFSGVIRKGQLVVVNPATKNVTVDGKVANPRPLYGGDSLKLVFDQNK